MKVTSAGNAIPDCFSSSAVVRILISKGEYVLFQFDADGGRNQDT